MSVVAFKTTAAAPRFRERLDALRKDTPKNRDRALALLNERYFTIGMGGDHVVCDEHDPDSAVLPLQELEFQKRYRPYVYTPKNGRAKALGKLWLEWLDRRSFDGKLVFQPEGAGDVSADNFNTWRGFRVKPKRGDWSLFRNHLREIVCRGHDASFEYLLKYFAHMVQCPGRLPGVAIVIYGPQGTGKTVVFRMFERLFRPFNTLLVEDPERITGRFNWHLANKVLVCADEALFARDPNLPGPLKSRITSEDIVFERKNIDPIKLNNFVRLLIFSNDEHVVHADRDERRFLVLRIADTFAQQPGESLSAVAQRRRDYFDPISRQMLHEGGCEAMFYDLKHLPGIADFDPRADLPDTQWLQEQKRFSRKPHEQWLASKLAEDTCPWFRNPDVRPTKRVVYADYCAAAPQFNRRDPVLSFEHFGRFLSRVFGVGVGTHRQQQTQPGGRKKLVPVYWFPTFEEARKLWNDYSGISAERLRVRMRKPPTR